MPGSMDAPFLHSISVLGVQSAESSIDNAEVAPFAGLMLSDSDDGDPDIAIIKLSDPSNGQLIDPNVATDSSIVANDILTVSGTPAELQAALAGLLFSPSPGLATIDFPVATTITAVIANLEGETASASTKVTATITLPPTPTPTPTPAPTPAPTPSDDPAAGVYGLLHNEYEYGSADEDGLQVINLVTGVSSQLSESQVVTFADGIAIADPDGTVGQVLRLYQAAFDRLPTAAEASGVDFWENALQQGSTLQAVAQGFTTTPEYEAHYAGTTNDQFVSALYTGVLGRGGDPSGQAFWDSALQSGASRSTVLQQFAESPENESRTIASSGANDAAEITRLYQAVFDRSPDASGLSFWQNLYDQGTSLLAIASGMQNSTEYQALYGGGSNDEFIQALYKNILGDSPGASSAGVQFWDNQLTNGASRANILIGFSDSLESRFQTSGSTHDGLVFLGS